MTSGALHRSVFLVLASLCAASPAVRAGDCGACLCGDFDEPDQLTRAGFIDLKDAHVVAGSEVYLANRTLAAGGGGQFVVPGRGAVEPGKLRFQARERIVLRPGFEARAGSRFEASIVPRANARDRERTTESPARR